MGRTTVGLLLVVLGYSCLVVSWAGALELTLIHTNDVHSRFRQVNAKGGFCSEVDEAHQACYGGFPRLFHKVSLENEQFRNLNSSTMTVSRILGSRQRRSGGRTRTWST